MQSTLPQANQRMNINPIVKRWLKDEEIQDECSRSGIGRKQAYMIFTGRSTNWQFLERIINRIQTNYSKVDRMIKQDQHLKNYLKNS